MQRRDAMKYLGRFIGKGTGREDTDKGSGFHITGAIDIWAVLLFIMRDCSGHHMTWLFFVGLNG